VNGSTYSRDCITSNYYYEAIQINVDESGYYSFVIDVLLYPLAHIYEDSFNPFNPLANEISALDDLCNGSQYKLTADLQVSTTYILVVTTHFPEKTGAFSILASGPNNLRLNRISEYLYYFVNNQHSTAKNRKCF
jgi:hypothetical protein